MSAHTSRKTYVVVAVVLAVLTALEVGVAYIRDPSLRTAVIIAMILLALTKAMSVALYYMHLKSETKYLRMVLGLPMLFPPLYALVLMLEAVWHTPLYLK